MSEIMKRQDGQSLPVLAAVPRYEVARFAELPDDLFEVYEEMTLAVLLVAIAVQPDPAGQYFGDFDAGQVVLAGIRHIGVDIR